MARLSDVGPFGAVPLWLLEIGLSGHAIHLYALIGAKYANQRNTSWPSRKTLVSDMGVSLATVDRAFTELRKVGAIVVRKRNRADGSQTSNDYELIMAGPPSSRKSRGGVSDDDPPSSPVTSQEPDPSEPDPENHKGTSLQNSKHRHRYQQFYCSEYMECVSEDQHFKFTQRVKSAGLDPEEFDWAAWYRERDAEWGDSPLEAREPKGSTFWLAVKLGDDVATLKRSA